MQYFFLSGEHKILLFHVDDNITFHAAKTSEHNENLFISVDLKDILM